jgi:signal transduction histidine kinase
VSLIVSASPIFNDEGTYEGSLAMLTDITDRKFMEKEIIEVSAAEQRRIGQDLHDVLGQNLTAIAIQCKLLEKKLEARRSKTTSEIAGIRTLINQAIEQTRALARGLYPVRSVQEGLMTALQKLAEDTGDLLNVPCCLICESPVLLTDNTMATHLYYIAKEAVTNAVRHGRPGHIEMRLGRPDGDLCLAIVDDGVGLPGESAEAGTTTGLGLKIMQYRASMLGASLEIRRGDSGGTKVVCSLRDTSDTF